MITTMPPTLGTLVGGGWFLRLFWFLQIMNHIKTVWWNLKTQRLKISRQIDQRNECQTLKLEQLLVLGRKLRWMSVVSNFIAAGYMAR